MPENTFRIPDQEWDALVPSSPIDSGHFVIPDAEWTNLTSPRLGGVEAEAEDRLKALPVAPQDLTIPVQRLASGAMEGGHEAVVTYANRLAAAGFPGAQRLADYPYSEQIQKSAVNDYYEFMNGMGILDVDGPGAADAKRRIRNSFTAITTVKNQPLFGTDRAKMAGAVVRNLTKERVSRILEEDGPIESKERIAALGQMVSQWSDDELDDVYKLARFLATETPVNDFDAAVFRRFTGNETLPGKTVLDVGINIVQPYVTAATTKIPTGQKLGVLQEIFGDNAPSAINAEFEKRKARYVLGQLNVEVREDGTMGAGQTADGYTFMPLAPKGDLDLLLKLKSDQEPIKEILDRYPSQQPTFLEIKSQHGEPAAQDYLRQVNQQGLQYMAEQVAKGVAVPDDETLVRGMTPFERKKAGVWADVGAVMERMGDMWNTAVRGTHELDKRISAIPQVQELIKLNAWGATGNKDIANQTKTITDLFKLLPTLYMEGKGLGDTFTPEAVRSYQEFLNASPEEMKALMDVSNDPLRFYREYHSESFKQLDESSRIMNDMITGKQEFRPGKFMWELAYTVMGQVWHGAAEPFAMIADDPAQLPVFLGTGLAGEKIAARGRAAMVRGIDQITYGTRIKNSLNQIWTHAPEQAKIFRDAIKKSVARNPDLSSAAAVAEEVVKQVNRTGHIKDAKGFSRVLDAWPDIKNELGAVGQAITESKFPKGITERLRFAWQALGGSPKGIDKNLAISITQQPLDDAANAIRSILGTGPEAEVMTNKYLDFVSKHERRPRTEELVDMMPEQYATFAGLMLAAERVPLQNSVISRAAAAVFGWRDTKILQSLVDSADNELARTAQFAVDDVMLQRRWGVKRLRSQVLTNVATNRKRNALRSTELAKAIDEAHGLPKDPTVDTRIKQQKLELQRLEAEQDRLSRHSFRESWEGPSAMVWAELDDAAVELILDTHPELFSGFSKEILYDYKISKTGKPTIETAKRRAEGFRKRIFQLQEELNNVRKDPIGNDRVVADLHENLAEMQKQQAAYKAADGLEDPKLASDITVMRQYLANRLRHLRNREVRATREDVIMAEQDAVIADHRRAQARYTELANGIARPTISEEGKKMFEDLIRHRGATDAMRDDLTWMKQRLAAIEGERYAGSRGNPFHLKWLPAWKRGQHVADTVRSTMAREMDAGARIEELTAILRKLPDEQKRLLSLAQRRQVSPRDLMKRPMIARAFKHLANEDLDTLQLFFEEEQLGFDQLMDFLEKSGKLPPHVLKSWRKMGYDPRLDVADELSELIVEETARKAMGRGRVQSVLPTQPFLHARGRAFQFKRHHQLWRVRVNEPDLVLDETFLTRQQAEKFLKDRYGDDIIGTLDKHKGGLIGKNPYGDEVRLAPPLSAAEKEARGFFGSAGEESLRGEYGTKRAKMHTAARRLKRMSEVLKDVTASSLIDTYNMHGGYVLDKAQHALLQQKYGNSVTSRFHFVPENKRAFGNMAGKYVHKQILAELNRASKLYDSLNSVVAGMREAFQADVPDAIKPFTPGAVYKAFDWVADAARSSLITHSIRSHIVNPLFNIISDYLAGTRVYSSENLDNLLWAAKQAGPTGKGRLTRDPIFQEARRNNLVTGLFETEDDALRNLSLDVMGINKQNIAQVRNLMGKTKVLHEKYRQLLLKGEDPPLLLTVQKKLQALEAALAELDQSRLKIGFKKFVGLWVRNRDAFGRPRNKTARFMRRWYNFYDEFFKLAQYANLRRQGLSENQAVKVVKTFSQNYAEVPYWLRGIHPAVRGMVVSFPYELMRITGNAARYRPHRLVGLLATLPMFNMMQLAQAGVSWDRWDQMLEARGKRTPTQGLLSMMSSMYLIDPRTKNITSEVDLSGLLPFEDLVANGHGMIAQAMDNMMPPEKRDGLQHAAAVGGTIASNFLFNHPIYNIGQFFLSGTDPVTGRPLLSPGAPLLQKVQEGVKIAGKTFIPPWMPGGRDFTAYEEAWHAPLNPRTGRPFHSQQPATALIRAASGIGLKGQAADDVGNLIGVGRGRKSVLTKDEDIILNNLYKVSGLMNPDRPDYPIYGPDREVRELYNRAIDSSFSPEERAEAEKQLDEKLKEEITERQGRLVVKRTRTEREVEMEKRSMEENGWQNFMAKQPIVQQVLAFILNEQAGVHDRLLREQSNIIKFTELGNDRVINDPGKVQEAIDHLEKAMERPTNQRVLELRNYLKEVVLPMSEVRRMFEPYRLQLQDARKEAIRRKFDG